MSIVKKILLFVIQKFFLFFEGRNQGSEHKFLLTVDKFMPKFYWRHAGLTYGDFGLFTKHRERIQN